MRCSPWSNWRVGSRAAHREANPMQAGVRIHPFATRSVRVFRAGMIRLVCIFPSLNLHCAKPERSEEQTDVAPRATSQVLLADPIALATRQSASPPQDDSGIGEGLMVTFDALSAPTGFDDAIHATLSHTRPCLRAVAKAEGSRLENGADLEIQVNVASGRAEPSVVAAHQLDSAAVRGSQACIRTWPNWNREWSLQFRVRITYRVIR